MKKQKRLLLFAHKFEATFFLLSIESAIKSSFAFHEKFSSLNIYYESLCPRLFSSHMTSFSCIPSYEMKKFENFVKFSQCRKVLIEIFSYQWVTSKDIKRPHASRLNFLINYQSWLVSTNLHNNNSLFAKLSGCVYKSRYLAFHT